MTLMSRRAALAAMIFVPAALAQAQTPKQPPAAEKRDMPTEEQFGQLAPVLLTQIHTKYSAARSKYPTAKATADAIAKDLIAQATTVIKEGSVAKDFDHNPLASYMTAALVKWLAAQDMMPDQLKAKDVQAFIDAVGNNPKADFSVQTLEVLYAMADYSTRVARVEKDTPGTAAKTANTYFVPWKNALADKANVAKLPPMSKDHTLFFVAIMQGGSNPEPGNEKDKFPGWKLPNGKNFAPAVIGDYMNMLVQSFQAKPAPAVKPALGKTP